jgi:hypothetical protein
MRRQGRDGALERSEHLAGATASAQNQDKGRMWYASSVNNKVGYFYYN